MNKEQMKDEIILIVKSEIGASSLGDYGVPLDDNDVDHVAEDIADDIYEAGYRKTFTSEIASDTQKAFKEGYLKGFNDGQEEFKIIIGRNEQLLKRNAQLEEKLSEFKKPIDKFIKDREAKAVKEFAEKLREKYGRSCSEYYPVLIELTSEQLDELLKECEK